MAQQPLSSLMQPTEVYGGDEISAIVLDPGYSSVRAGFAGEDTPKSFISSHYGFKDGNRIFGDDKLYTPRPGLEIRNPMNSDGLVEDWDTATQLWEYSFASSLIGGKQKEPRSNGLNDDLEDDDVNMEGVEESEKPLEEYPLLMSEPAWSTAKSREKSIEIAMENWGCPAFWLGRNTVLAAYGAGKATALVIDVGAANASVIAVHDGIVLKKSIQRSPLAGNWLSSQIRHLFNTQEPKVNLVPHFMVTSKTQVDAGAPPQATYRPKDPAITKSYISIAENLVLDSFKESVVEVYKGPGRLNATGPNGVNNLDTAKSHAGHSFEMPDGYNQIWGVDRYQLAEGFFDEKAPFNNSSSSSNTATNGHDSSATPPKTQTVTGMVAAALSNIDVDIRNNLLQNIVVTGGTTILNGFLDRLQWELPLMYQGARIRIQAAGLSAERRFGSWVGGSILGSLGTFHQMWISRKEYEEFGTGVVEKRCK